MESIKKKIQIVVARYNENIEWLIPYKDITIIYNKGNYEPSLNKFTTINLENFGRESHTYLYHIINNYNDLAERTIFFQGRINDHKILEIEDYFSDDKKMIGKTKFLKINDLKNKIPHYGKWKIEYENGSMKKSDYTPFDWLTKIIGLNINKEVENVIWGANFSISKEAILKKPKKFYENIIRFIDYHKNPEEGHFIERGWYMIINNDFIHKKKIGYLYVNDNIDKVKKILENNKLDEIHLWTAIKSNFEYGLENKINYTPDNNKYILINPLINPLGYCNNNFNIDIKAKNDAHILIEFETYSYEIVLGGWNNNRSVIRDYYKETIINANDGKILDPNNYIKVECSFSEKIIIKVDNNILFENDNSYNVESIKNIKIKSYFGSDAYWNYTNNYTNNDNIKLHLCNNCYNNIDNFYKNNYLEYYIEKIDLLEYILF